jgi:hypothetical protein
VPHGWFSVSSEIKGVPQTEQKGGLIQRISEWQSEQNPFWVFFKGFPQQGHWEGIKKSKTLSAMENIHFNPSILRPGG